MWSGKMSRLLDGGRSSRTPKYPAYDSFVESVREEAIQNVKRLRHHPSIVIFGEYRSTKGFAI